jgi:hypothetical protein
VLECELLFTNYRWVVMGPFAFVGTTAVC